MTQQTLFFDGYTAACKACGVNFSKHADHHVYCSSKCRQQGHRNRHATPRTCPGCGVELSGRARHCGNTCYRRLHRWRTNGRLLVCHNSGCNRCNIKMVHPYDKDSGMWLCNGCGQLQPW